MASPVNTYVRPAEPAPSSLHQLAEGLAAFDSGLSGFLRKRTNEKAEADYQKGLAASYRENGQGYEEGVRQGLIPPQESPRFMEGFKSGQGNLAGMRLKSQFRREFLQWEGREKGDADAFGLFLQDFITKNVPEDSDPHFLKGLNPHVDSLFNEGFAQFTEDSSNAVYSEGLNTDTATLSEVIRTHEEDARANPSGTDYESIWTHTLGIREEALRRGTRHADIDAHLVDTIILNAERTKDEGLLALLDRTLPDAEHPMFYGLEVQKKRDAAAERITNAKVQDESDKAVAREKAEEKLAGQVYAEIATIWTQNIDEEIPENVIEDLSRIDPQARSKLVDLRKKMAEADGIEDKATIARIFADIHEGTTTKRDIMAHFERGTIRSTETLNQALDRVDRVEKERREGTGILGDASVKKWHGLIESLTSSDPLNPLGGAGPSDEGMEAIHDMNMMVLRWETDNPQASLVERQEAINRIGNIIRQRIELPPSMTRGGIYAGQQPEGTDPTSEPAIPSPLKPEPQETIPQALPPQASPQADPEAEGGLLDLLPNPLESGRQLIESLIGGGEADEEADSIPNLESLPEDQRQAVNDLAERHGVDPETAHRDIWRKVQGLMSEEGGEADPGIDQTTTNAVPEDIQQRLTDLLNNPPQLPDDAQARIPTAPILALIGRTEGTDRGDGYNETLSYGAFTGGDVNLVGMTLDEVDTLQTRMLRHPGNSWNSSAIGRYQIVRTTLRSLRKELGLNGTELYDESMQDRLALALLERRGLSKWRSGELSDKAFLNSLAQEWASLPTAKGKGHYKGQRASATPAQVLKALYGGPPGHSSATLKRQGTALPEGTPAAYATIPDMDEAGRPGQIAKFIEWNSDPVGNHEANLASIDPTLSDVVTRAQAISGVKFVIGSGKRDEDLQKKAVEWGWSKTHDSDHLDGRAVDLWPIDDDGAVTFDDELQTEIVRAMKQAAGELGVPLDIGDGWKRHRDRPHFAIKAAARKGA